MTIQGSVTVLGITQDQTITVDQDGATFTTSGSVLGVFDGELSVTASYDNIQSSAYQITGKIYHNNGIFSYNFMGYYLSSFFNSQYYLNYK